MLCAKKIVIAPLLVTLLAGCVSGPAPSNYGSARWAPGQHDESDRHPEGNWVKHEASRDLRCDARKLPSTPIGDSPPLRGHVLASGDRLHVAILGDPEMMSGMHVVEADGFLSLTGNLRVRAADTDIGTFQDNLRAALLAAGYVRPLMNAVRVTLAEATGVEVFVSGAVFEPGPVMAGVRRPETRIGQKEGEATGDANQWRTLTSALRAAGGVRPDADLSNVVLIRGGRPHRLDLSQLPNGLTYADPILAAGDQIVIAKSGCFDPNLVRPLAVTAPGIRVFMSNLTRSANNNAGAAISGDTTSLPYGTRMLQALFAMNCVGGSYMQSDRRAVLVSRNPINGQSIVVEREIEDLVRMADRDAANPYLMPGDALACYDSRWTNFREALGLVGEAMGAATPAILLQRAVD